MSISIRQGLTFKEFQLMNAERCEKAFGHTGSGPDKWGLLEWALAIAGEAGELANLVKKVRRGDFTLEEVSYDILREVADVITYCDALVTFLDADTGEIVQLKFDEVSARIGYVPE